MTKRAAVLRRARQAAVEWLADRVVELEDRVKAQDEKIKMLEVGCEVAKMSHLDILQQLAEREVEVMKAWQVATANRPKKEKIDEDKPL